MTSSTRFLSIPKEHFLVTHSFEIPQYSGPDAFDKTLDYVSKNYPGLIKEGLSYGEKIAVIFPLFHMHDARLIECVPDLSIDAFKDAAIALSINDFPAFLTLIRYCSFKQFSELNSLPDILSAVRIASLENLEPYLSSLEVEARNWINESKAFSDPPISELIYKVQKNEAAREKVKDIPPLSLILCTESLAPLAKFMSEEQIKAIAEFGSSNKSKSVIEALKLSKSPLIAPFLEALEYNKPFFHVIPRYSLEKVQFELEIEVNEFSRIESIRLSRFKIGSNEAELDQAVAFYDSVYYQTAYNLIKKRLNLNSLAIERFNALVGKIKPFRTLSASFIPQLVSLLKHNPCWFISAFSEKQEFVETCKYIKDNDPNFAVTLSILCKNAMNYNRSLIHRILDMCAPYEKNLVLSHLIKITDLDERVELCNSFLCHIDRLIDLWNTIDGPVPDERLILIFHSIYDNMGSQSAIDLAKIPAMRKAILDRLPDLSSTLISAFIDQVDPATQVHIIRAEKSLYDRLHYLTKVGNNTMRAYFSSINNEEFRKLLNVINSHGDSDRLLSFLLCCTDEQLNEIEHFPNNFFNCTREMLLNFMSNITHERKLRIIEMKVKGMKGSDFVKSCVPKDVSEIPPFLLIFIEPDEAYFKGERARHFSEMQIATVAEFGKRAHAIALEEGLKQNEDRIRPSMFQHFYYCLSKNTDDKGIYTLSECASAFDAKLKMLLDKAKKAFKQFDQGEYGYDAVIKPLRRCYRAFRSKPFKVASEAIKERAKDLFDFEAFQELETICERINSDAFRDKSGALRGIL